MKTKPLNINSISKTKNERSFILTAENGARYFLDINLVKFQLDIPYMKSDGTPVTAADIQQKKAKLLKNKKSA